MNYRMIKITLLITGFMALSVWGSDSISLNQKYTLTPEQTITNIEIKTIRPIANYQIETGSNSMPFKMMSKMVLGGYVSPDQIESITNSLSENNRLGFFQSWHVGLYPIPKLLETQSGNKISLKQVKFINESFGAANFTKDAFGLLFRGNTSYLGKEINTGNNRLRTFAQQGIRLDFEKNSITWGLQVHQITNYNSLETNNFSVYSSIIGDSIAMRGSLYSQSSKPNENAGWGAQLNFSFYKRIGSAVFFGGFENLGINQLNNLQTIYRGVQFENSSIDPVNWVDAEVVNIVPLNLAISDLVGSKWFKNSRDTLIKDLGFDTITQRGSFITPVHLFAQYHKNLTSNSKSGFKWFNVRLDYRYLWGYLPKLSTTWNYKFSTKGALNNLNVLGGLSFGGFDTWDLNAGVLWYTNPINLKFQLTGIESFIAPSSQHGGGMQFTLLYPFY